MDKKPLFEKRDIIPVTVICFVGLIAFASYGGKPESAAAAVPPDWHAAVSGGGCAEFSPASFMELARSVGVQPEAKEKRDKQGVLVEVTVTANEPEGRSTVIFYRTKAACDASITKATHIPDEYR